MSLLRSARRGQVGGPWLLVMEVGFLGVLMTQNGWSAPHPTSTETLKILDQTFVTGHPVSPGTFSDNSLGIRFKIPWKRYQVKTPQQLEALILEQRKEDQKPPVVYLVGIYPESSVPIRMKDFSTLGGTQGHKNPGNGVPEGAYLPYVPFLVVWYQREESLKSESTFRDLISELNQTPPFQRFFAANSFIDLMGWQGALKEKLVKIEQHSLAQRLTVDLRPVQEIKRRVMIQGLRGHLLYFGLFYQDPVDRRLLDTLGRNIMIHKRSQLLASQGPSLSFFNATAIANQTGRLLGTLFGISVVLMTWWLVRRMPRKK